MVNAASRGVRRNCTPTFDDIPDSAKKSLCKQQTLSALRTEDFSLFSCRYASVKDFSQSGATGNNLVVSQGS